MSSPHTRAYQDGVLKAENFPVADVSDYLEEADTVVWVDFCGPSAGAAPRAGRRAGPARARRRGRARRAPAAEARPLRDPPVPRRPRGRGRHRDRRARRDRDRRVHQRPLARSPSARTTASRWTPCSSAGTARPTSPSTASASCSTGCSTSSSTATSTRSQAFDEYYDEVSEGLFAEQPLDPAKQRHWFQMRQALVRFHRLVVPHARGGQQPDAPRARPSSPSDLYPYYQDVYDHILRVSESTRRAPRPRRHDRRDQPQPARLPPEPDHEEGHQLGGDHRRPHPDHRLLRDERPLPGLRQTWGVVMSAVLMVLLSGGLYLVFRRREWL